MAIAKRAAKRTAKRTAKRVGVKIGKRTLDKRGRSADNRLTNRLIRKGLIPKRFREGRRGRIGR